MGKDDTLLRTHDIKKRILEQKQRADIELGNVEEAHRIEQMLYHLDEQLAEELLYWYDRDLADRGEKL